MATSCWWSDENHIRNDKASVIATTARGGNQRCTATIALLPYHHTATMITIEMSAAIAVARAMQHKLRREFRILAISANPDEAISYPSEGRASTPDC